MQIRFILLKVSLDRVKTYNIPVITKAPVTRTKPSVFPVRAAQLGLLLPRLSAGVVVPNPALSLATTGAEGSPLCRVPQGCSHLLQPEERSGLRETVK